ncbi:hypothetical protein GY45DRAFT_1343524 [Cubamyces sp. BRFM 1775]|nr:hypothetical protein GY45DRAFT_1343524 [Cubamyces sp. BRFM 1775]
MPTPAPDRSLGLAVRATNAAAFIPADSLTQGDLPSTTPTGAQTSSTASSTTSDSPFFPTPTDCASCDPETSSDLKFTKSAVEGALIVAAIALIFAFSMWRVLCLRRENRPLSHFFRIHSHPHTEHSVPTARPPTVPRTTGLPPTRAPPASLIVETLSAPAPLAQRPRRGRGRRTYAGDIDAMGRRGPITHPDDPEENLPEYDDKDVLPRYQDLEAGRARSAPVPTSIGEDLGRVSDAGRMVGVGAGMMGRSPNRDGGTSDTDPLVMRMQLSGTATSEDDHVYPPMSSAGSHEGHGDLQRHA